MTHSLHRRGSTEDLREEIVFIFAPAKGITERGSGPKAKKFLEIMKARGAAHYGDDLTGNVLTLGHSRLVAAAHDITNIHAVFADVEKATEAFQDIVEEDMGVSVVVTGLFDVVHQCCQRTGTGFHTIEHSMGIWGRTEQLPSEQVLEIVTMCGHGLVSVNLVDQVARDVRVGRTTAQEATYEMARQCMCGIFNPVRAEKVLRRLAGE